MTIKEGANDFISVILPTYNPNILRLKQTLQALQQQTLALHNWELIIIDNNSTTAFGDGLDLQWHPNHKITHEPKQGLTYARLNGLDVSKGGIIIMIDDDNVPNKRYLEIVKNTFESDKTLGAIGGKSLPIFETTPPHWLKKFYGNLALRNLGEDIKIESWQNVYPQYAPIGAGMAIRKTALKTYISKVESNINVIADRSGSSLASGGDNDMVLEILKSGWRVGYFPQLSLNHIIPKERMEVAYLARLLNNTNNSWIKLLQSHGINPWKKIPEWTLPLRKVKAWFIYKAFAGKANYINWQGYCGTMDALAQIGGKL